MSAILPNLHRAKSFDVLLTSRRSSIVPVVWMTGLSGAGKSTLATEASVRLHAQGLRTAIVDGDQLRMEARGKLGFSRADRSINCKKATEVAIALGKGGAIVFVSLISPFRDDRMAAARRVNEEGLGFMEILIKAELSVCETRDPKGLYLRARQGLISSFTGISSDYEEPLNPNLVINTDKESVEMSTNALVNIVVNFRRYLS